MGILYYLELRNYHLTNDVWNYLDLEMV
jgi:hypothetical protein